MMSSADLKSGSSIPNGHSRPSANLIHNIDANKYNIPKQDDFQLYEIIIQDHQSFKTNSKTSLRNLISKEDGQILNLKQSKSPKVNKERM